MGLASREWDQVKPPLSKWVVDTVKSFGYSQMTPVQASVLPLFCGNKDVVVEAVTGSGKTLAFVIPAIERVLKCGDSLKSGQTNAVIIAPTRELAEQIFGVLQSILDMGKNFYDSSEDKSQFKIRSQLLIGGSTTTHADLSIFLQTRPHIIVATPGRLLELLSSPKVYTNAVDLLVLDEADRLLDLGFETTLSKILSLLPKQKRSGLFSATITDAVGNLVKVGLRNPVKVVVSSGSGKSQQKIPTSLGIKYMVVSPRQKIPALLSVFRQRISEGESRKAIVYFPSCIGVTYFYGLLNALMEQYLEEDVRPKLFSLHGKLPPGPRHNTLERFTKYTQNCILLTTDVAARGLDIPEVDFVLQLDPPSDPNMFLHRAGRAGRAGRTGEGLVMLTPGSEESYVDFLAVRKVYLQPEPIPDELDDIEPFCREWILEDRARHDLAIRSFLSYVRFYAKHTASSIFRHDELDLFDIARGYQLLRMPRMPELKKKKLSEEETWLGPVVDMDSYSYQDPQREASRKAQLEEQKKQNEEKQQSKKRSRESNKAWSEKLERKDNAVERRAKRRARREAKHAKEVGSDDSSDEETPVDWKDLVKERKKQKTQEVAAFDDL